jgi:excinuclease ABC subunit A
MEKAEDRIVTGGENGPFATSQYWLEVAKEVAMTDVFAHGRITVRGARENNLKNITVDIPKNRLVVLTGISGSGKSSLAYDTLQKECIRQYMESLGMVTFFLSKPKVDAIIGLSPSISVDQVRVNRSPRSTVGTSTDVYTYLRILFARLGERDCPECGMRVAPPLDAGTSTDEGDEGYVDEADDEEYFACPHCGGRVPEMSMAHLSFNKPEGACERCTGLGTVYDVDLSTLVDEEKSMSDGAVTEWNRNQFMVDWNRNTLAAAGKHYGFTFDFDRPVKDLGRVEKDLLYWGVYDERFRRHFPEVQPPETVRTGRFEGIATGLLRRYAEHIENPTYLQRLGGSVVETVCPACGGTRLKEYSRRVTVLGGDISGLAELPLSDLLDWVRSLKTSLAGQALVVAQPIIADLEDRIARLVDAGVGYLSMSRASTTLSGGEAQRIRLAALLGSGLTGVLYVLDEPTKGLHSRDTGRLLKVLKTLRDLGNTILVIEHDTDVMLAADYIIDMGPGAGPEGGRVVATGTPEAIIENPDSVTGRCLRAMKRALPARARRNPSGQVIIRGAREHNLKDITVSIPTGTLTAITGVTGSGKSTLIFDILGNVARVEFNGSRTRPGTHDEVIGLDNFERVVTVDQTPIARVPRSNAATYTDVFTPIRNLYAALPGSKDANLTARDFSFNVPGGRCERCEGAGVVTVDMHFLPDVEVICPVCRGKRFKKTVLSVRYQGYNISDVLDLSIQEAYDLFSDRRDIEYRLKVLVEVGMGYLKLGQPATTLSGGEAQRVKLAKELGRTGKGRTLYLLDEPTMGLHPADLDRLMVLLTGLVDGGNTVCVVEHNLDLISSADWVIDLGPEGGRDGGRVIAEGTPEDVAAVEASYTGRCLRAWLDEGRPGIPRAQRLQD